MKRFNITKNTATVLNGYQLPIGACYGMDKFGIWILENPNLFYNVEKSKHYLLVKRWVFINDTIGSKWENIRLSGASMAFICDTLVKNSLLDMDYNKYRFDVPIKLTISHPFKIGKSLPHVKKAQSNFEKSNSLQRQNKAEQQELELNTKGGFLPQSPMSYRFTHFITPKQKSKIDNFVKLSPYTN